MWVTPVLHPPARLGVSDAPAFPVAVQSRLRPSLAAEARQALGLIWVRFLACWGVWATVGPTGCSEAPGARRQRGRASRAPAPRRPSPLASLCSLGGQAPVTCLGPCGALARPERLTAFIPRGSGWLRPHCPSRVSPWGPPPAWAAVSAPRSAAFCGGQLSVPSLTSLRPSTQPRSARRARWLWDGPARSRGGEGHRRHGACAGPCGSPGASTGS